MSYDIDLVDPLTKETLQLDSPHQMKGGTYAVGGEKRAHFNITYNYSKFYYDLLGEKGIRTIYGMTGAESIPLLKEACSKMSDDINEDYWKATEGNAKRALLSLISLAQLRPDGVWDGD
jgi:hypothetical protein